MHKNQAKITFWAYLSDLLPIKQSLFDKLGSFAIPDEKHHMFRTQSINHILQSLKKAGFEGLELCVPNVLTDKNIQEVKNIIKKHALSIFAVHQSNNNINNIPLSEIQRLCKIANNFSANIVTLHSDALGKKLFNQEFILELKKLQKKHKITFGIENMPKSPFSLFKTYTYKPNEFSSVINNAELSMTLDTTHLGQAQGDICEFYAKNKEKIINIHLSDYKNSWLNRILLLANKTHLPLNEGELPIAKFLKTLKKGNYQGLMTMEINANLNKLCQNARLIRDAFQ